MLAAALAAAMAASPVAVRAGEGGVTHIIPGSMATLADNAPTAPTTFPKPMYLNYDGSATAVIPTAAGLAGNLAIAGHGGEAAAGARDQEPPQRRLPLAEGGVQVLAKRPFACAASGACAGSLLVRKAVHPERQGRRHGLRPEVHTREDEEDNR